MDAFALTAAEQSLRASLRQRGVPYLIIGLDAAVLEGAPFAAEAIEHTVDGVAVTVLPVDRVVASKRATNRAKDISALPALEATLRARDSS